MLVAKKAIIKINEFVELIFKHLSNNKAFHDSSSVPSIWWLVAFSLSLSLNNLTTN